MPELYRLTDWSADGSSANLGAYDDLDPEMQSIVMGLAQRIYDGEKITYDPDLLQATVKPYIDGITKGYGKSLADVDWNTPDAKTLQKLTENVFQFSASKDFHILSDMTAALKGSDGKMRSFDDFRAEVDKMNVKYNQNWLRTEYNQAVASSQCAARWTDFEKHSKSMPFLQYQAVMDGNTRAEHAALHGVIKRVDSDFWDKYYPPNGWGCRCEVIQLPGKNHKETPAEAIKFCKVDDMWKVNVGKKGVVFPKGHPYFMGQCQRCNGTPKQLAINPQCAACVAGTKECREKIEKLQLIAERKQEYEQYQNDADYVDVQFDPKTGALKARNIDHIIHTHGETFFGNMTTTMLEQECQDELYRLGHKAILEKEMECDANGNWLTALDLTFNKERVDIASITGNGYYGWQMYHKNDQVRRWNARPDVNTNTESFILYFHDPSMFTEAKMQQSIPFFQNLLIQRGEQQHIKKVYCVIKGSNEIKSYNL